MPDELQPILNEFKKVADSIIQGRRKALLERMESAIVIQRRVWLKAGQIAQAENLPELAQWFRERAESGGEVTQDEVEDK